VKNIGQNPGGSYYRQWGDGLYFSKDTIVSNDDLFAGPVDLNSPLNNGETYTTTHNNFIAPKMAEGNYYVYVTTNYNKAIHAEKQLNNNSNFKRDASGNPQQVFVMAPLLPDLADSILTLTTRVAKGQPLQVKYMVLNKGAGVTYPGSWSDEFWLSSDYIAGNTGDIYLGSVNHTGALQPGGVYIDSIVASINLNVPAGNYILIANTNVKAAVFETDNTNNTAFSYVTIYNPAPVDLMVQDVVHADTVLLGYESKVSWTLVNNSSNPLNASETDGIYLSRQLIIDSTSTLIGTRSNRLNMLPLGSVALESSPVFQGVTEGLYNVLVKADVLNNIVENNKDNNSTAALKQVYILAKELVMEVTSNDQLKSLPLYYKLVIPSSLSGATILLTLTSKDSLAVTNQVFIGLDYIPSPSHFVYQYNRPNAGNQQVLMPSVIPGVYYIMVRSIGTRTQDISLTAHNLPFAIIDVNSREGGNTGNVTVKLTGSLFTNNMKATLKNNSATVVASQVYFINSISVFATFNLKGVPLGEYDVILSKGDTASVSLAKGFSVVNANNGGLITGSGINKGQTGSGNEPGCDPGATSGLNAQLQTEIIIPPKVFAGWPFVIHINYANPTNVDIPVQTRILYSKDGVPISLTNAGLADNKTTLYLEFANQEGPAGMIRAGGTGSISIFSKAPPNYPGHKIANYELK
jgi:hypothetical protein